MSAEDRVGIHFTTKYDSAPTARVRVPSRLNLIGEHTDYNDGFVLPFAIDREMWIALRPRRDGTVHIRSESFVEEVSFDLAGIKKGSGWGEYVKGVASALAATGRQLRGFDAFLASDIPMGAGMSSSAAVCIGSAVSLAVASDFYLQASELATLSKRAENDWVGVESGIMDPLVMAGAHRGFAQLIDCRDYTTSDIAIPPDIVAAVLDTGTRRGHVSSAYNLTTVGRLMIESHASLRDDFEVSSPPLDAMVTAANETPGCIGARMMGGGFGGVAVALLERSRAESFKRAAAESFTNLTGLPAHVHVVEAVDGVVALAGS